MFCIKKKTFCRNYNKLLSLQVTEFSCNTFYTIKVKEKKKRCFQIFYIVFTLLVNFYNKYYIIIKIYKVKHIKLRTVDQNLYIYIYIY